MQYLWDVTLCEAAKWDRCKSLAVTTLLLVVSVQLGWGGQKKHFLWQNIPDKTKVSKFQNLWSWNLPNASLDTIIVITIAIIFIAFPVSACRLPVSEDLAENKCSPSTYCLLTKYANDTSGKKGSNVCSTKIHLWVDLMILYLFFSLSKETIRGRAVALLWPLYICMQMILAQLYIYICLCAEQNKIWTNMFNI